MGNVALICEIMGVDLVESSNGSVYYGKVTGHLVCRMEEDNFVIHEVWDF